MTASFDFINTNKGTAAGDLALFPAPDFSHSLVFSCIPWIAREGGERRKSSLGFCWGNASACAEGRTREILSGDIKSWCNLITGSPGISSDMGICHERKDEETLS